MKTMRATMFGFLLILAATFAFAAEQKPAPAKPIALQAEKKGTAAKQSEQNSSQPAAKGGQLDINTATEAELRTIPDIGDTYAKKIIAGRPYAKKDQLKTKKIVPDDVYGKIKDKIVAKQAKK
jgi:DNA uptake protein ComE-like DNA-binding protein